jgi:predicted amidohydrolase
MTVTMLTVATCQFPVSADIETNYSNVARQIETAADEGADVVHFPEAALSGYAGIDFVSWEGFDWETLRNRSRRVLQLADDHSVWVVLGSSHPLSDQYKPHNSLYIINDHGEIVDRYDKRFCAGDPKEDPGPYNDLAYYSPGDHLSVFEVQGVTCGALICYDYRFPELYRAYKRHGVQLLFHSYHAGGIPRDRYEEMQTVVNDTQRDVNPGTTIPAITVPATMIARAANNFMWISCPNSSAPESCWPAFFVRPDGVITDKLTRNQAGVLISSVDTDASLYDSTESHRERAIGGVLHSGESIQGPRSEDRNSL